MDKNIVIVLGLVYMIVYGALCFWLNGFVGVMVGLDFTLLGAIAGLIMSRRRHKP